MNKKVKIILVILGLLTMLTGVFIVGGLYTMEIEDHYGDNQDVYYKSRQGDIAVNRDTKEFRTIEKTWKRIYTVDNVDAVDMWSWLDKNRIEIYRPETNELSDKDLSYEDIQNLIDTKELELIIKNR